MNANREIQEFGDGDVVFWIEQGTIHIKTVEPHGDPVELTENEAKRLGAALLEAVRQIEAPDS